jgi:hypothetical protein
VVSVILALIAALMQYARADAAGGYSDFSTAWFGARMLLDGLNPYESIGPGRLVEMPSPPFYPAPAFVVAMPFTIFPFHWASTVFVFLSTLLLAWGCTADSWHRLPIFPSIVFVMSAQFAQWSILFTAAVFIPMLAVFAAAKPQASLPVIAGSSESTPLIAAVVGAVVLVGSSFLLVPSWLGDWWALIQTSDHFTPPILQFGGPAIALVLLRWRRPEAWLVFVAACSPQTWYPYNGLILLVVAATYREASVLSLVSSVGWILAFLTADGKPRSPETRAIMSAILIAACYLPATIVVLRHPNVGPAPFWLEWLPVRFLRSVTKERQ